jgi:DNA uptake protein ComE-like DNA-binding protein
MGVDVLVLKRLLVLSVSALVGLCAMPQGLAQEMVVPRFPLGFENLSPVLAQQRSYAPPPSINLNTADVNELMTLPYITQSMALAIIRFRPYRAVADLNRVRSFSPAQVRQLSSLLAARVVVVAPQQLQQ